MDESTHKKLLFSRASIVGQVGMEGAILTPGQFLGNSIAVLTSGGDAQGMNSAVRAIVRMGIYSGCRVFLIHEGYQGMVDGGENIREASWADVSGIIQLGGTVIGSARCQDFREKPGRMQAAKNLIHNGITNLIIIGGDGSLTGADCFRHEWPELTNELLKAGQISQEAFNKCERLHIVGLVGSIDNDFCGTDMTIGTDSALHRIIEASDAITSTAQSHQRCFVLEVMGRHCGYLALVASLACEADWVFIPEHPPELDWEETLCRKLSNNRQMGKRINMIIIAEGAIDSNCQPIKTEYVRNLIATRLQLDTRITVLGHVQRGGAPSAFDRVLGIRMGAEAVLALMHANAHPEDPATVISLDGNIIRRVPLVTCVEKTREIATAMKNKDFALASSLRGKSFNNNLRVYLALSKLHGPPETHKEEAALCIGMVNVGAPASGVNAAMRSFVRISINNGYNVKAICEGFRGLASDKVRLLSWNDVRGWTGIGGSQIGCRRYKPQDIGLDKVAAKFREHNLSALLLIGGFEAYTSLVQLHRAREQFSEFRIPMIVIPATISNNLPGSDFTLGADTALNEITQIVDKLKQSALGTTRRVFVVETMGGCCGYLATVSGLAGGADAAYIHEEPMLLDDLLNDVKHLRAKMEDNVTRGLILRCDGANPNFSSDFVHRLYSEESKGVFDCRLNVLGHVQQGGVPTPFDRNLGTKMGAKVATQIHQEIVSHLAEKDNSSYQPIAALLGIIGKESKFSPVSELEPDTDWAHRIPRKQWWMRLRSVLKIMAKHETIYEYTEDTEDANAESVETHADDL